MPTLGEELRHKREQRGITLAEIAEATRIGTRFLKAIENNNFSTLPGGIFTRSFIRAYAKHVGMNEDEAIGLYLQQVAEPADAQPGAVSQLVNKTPPQEVAKLPPPSAFVAKQPSVTVARADRFEPVALRRSPSRTSWPTIVIGVGIVIFVVIIVIALVKQLNQGGSDTGSQTTSNQNQQKNAAPKQSQGGAQSATPSGSRPSNEPAAAPPMEPLAPQASVPAGQSIVVKVEAESGDSWISYQADDSKPTSLILKKGETREVPPAQKQVAFSYGNRMVLKIRINNRDANFPPDTPKFKSKVILSRENLQSFFQ